MPATMMRNGLTAENSIFSQKPSNNVSSSDFDIGRLNCFTGDIGAIIPVDVFRTLPFDEFQLSCQYKVDFRPMLVPTLTSYKCRIHYFWCSDEALWSGAETFHTKGRSGNLNLQMPRIDTLGLGTQSASVFPKLSGLTDTSFKSSDGTYFPYCTGSLLDYMLGAVPYEIAVPEDMSDPEYTGYLPFRDNSATMVATGYKQVKANALPFLMYQKVFRSNYLDPNLYDNGTVKSSVWFPEDIDSSHWRFNYANSNIGGSYNAYFVPDTITTGIPASPVANFVPIPSPVSGNDNGDNCVNLTQLRYAMYTSDMFTTALPFLQRGMQTTLDLDVVDSIIQSSFVGSGVVSSSDNFQTSNGEKLDAEWGTALNLPGLPVNDLFLGFYTAKKTHLGITDSLSSGSTWNVSYFIPEGSVSSSLTGAKVALTAEKLRSLLAVSVWQERNALTNGTYGQFIKVHFGDYPNNTWYEPVYVGGTSSVFDVNAIMQTSESNKTPLGEPAGYGGSSNNQSVGTFRSPDFGFMLVLMSIIPDSVYVQGAEHWMFDKDVNDDYMPEFERLSYQPILNKMLYVSGDEGESDSVDDALFGYSNRYVYYKQRDSIARGRFALPSDIDAYYHSYVQSRIFTTTPKLSQQFVTVYPPNIDRSFLAYPGMPAFNIQFYSGVRARRRMSYSAKPNDFGF